jgi:hypothetical protein
MTGIQGRFMSPLLPPASLSLSKSHYFLTPGGAVCQRHKMQSQLGRSLLVLLVDHLPNHLPPLGCIGDSFSDFFFLHCASDGGRWREGREERSDWIKYLVIQISLLISQRYILKGRDGERKYYTNSLKKLSSKWSVRFYFLCLTRLFYFPSLPLFCGAKTAQCYYYIQICFRQFLLRIDFVQCVAFSLFFLLPSF